MKEKIIKAAEEVFSERGFHETKIYQIAEKAGVSVGTIYRFFESKEELYLTVVHSKLSKLEEEVKKAVSGKSPTLALKSYISAVIDFFLKEDGFFKLFIREVGVFSVVDEERFKISEWYRNYLKNLSSIIKKGIETGEFRKSDPYALSLAVSGVLKNMIYCHSKGMLNGDTEYLKKEIEDFILNGLLNK
ncbi:transcriptional regulator, TetR family [Desulfurobacterium pacificum]|uniref:Transcriptional regulator, TetR family n=1 Tax=Desulfurobacterium pacificum TaxID=240166 RepID=A0ABY1NB08_9BACT|nr:TetR/AcrR family transcriptional regulator [Desulfurobacterium pacificum]SMP04796.1 transcriptional regulator, TetR family [Desulfurobacterium pacificum]